MDKPTIKITHLTKKYKLYKSQKDRLLEIMLPNQERHTTKTVIDDMNLEIKKGEILGILGKNGAGKSTLLKMITGVLTPTHGDIEVNGTISSLLELGTAFNGELTGYENIFLHGQINGLTNEQIQSKVDDIINFADIGDFINQPVKTYSSGMFARLAFSTSIHIDPEILLVDEVLSVGDLRFQEKSIEKMKQMVKSGCTVLFVTNSLMEVRQFCTRAIWLENGKIKMDGGIREVTEEYERYMKELEKPSAVTNQQTNNEDRDKADKTIHMTKASTDRYVYRTGEDIQIKIELEHLQKVNNFGVGLIIYNEKGEMMTILNTAREEMELLNNPDTITVTLNNNRFGEGEYFVTVSICDPDILYSYDLVQNACSFTVELERNTRGTNKTDGLYICEHEWNF